MIAQKASLAGKTKWPEEPCLARGKTAQGMGGHACPFIQLGWQTAFRGGWAALKKIRA